MKRTKRNTYLWQLLATLLLLVTTGMFSACSSDDTNATPATTPDSEIRFDVGVWNMMEGTRATTFDNSNFDSFICVAYNHETDTSPYIDNVQVNNVSSIWTFDGGSRYWPASGTLDFFAYAPTGNIPSYITAGPTYSYSSGQQMTFTCALPTTGATQGGDVKEFVYALAANQDKTSNEGNGVSLTFQHPFAKIILQLSASHPSIQINKITFKSIKNNGSFSHVANPKWTLNGVATDLVLTFEGAAATFNNNTTTKQIGPTFLMIPQAWAGAIEVEATWNDWGVSLKHTLTTSVPSVTWQPGYSYTYTFTISETDLIVSSDKYTEQW